MAGVADDISDIKNSVAYGLLVELERDGKLTPNRAEEFKEKFRRLHEVVVQSFENEKTLLNKARELRQELQKQQHKLESVLQRQTETSLSLERLNKTLEDTQAELDQAEQRVQVLEWEIGQLEQDRNEAMGYLEQREQEQQAKLLPEIQSLTTRIEEAKAEIAETLEKIAREEATQKELDLKITVLSKEMEALQDESQMTSMALEKARSEPQRFAKNADILNKAILVMKGDLNKAESEQNQCIADVENLNDKQQTFITELAELQDELKQKIQYHQELQQKGDAMIMKKRQVQDVEKNIREKQVEVEVELKAIQDSIRNKNDSLQELGKRLHALKKEHKKHLTYQRQINTQLTDINRQIEEAREREQALQEEKARQDSVMQKLDEEKNIMMSRYLQGDEEQKDKGSRLETIRRKIEQAEVDAQKAREEENELTRKMEWLSLQREHMARKASQNIAQARETAEELKIKELLLIDLKKKQQETKTKLDSYIVMYEEVKNARNKYVKLIQNSSQELAETKERIKILQNEVEILRNESSDKDRKLKQERHEVQDQHHERDTLQRDINEYQYQIKQKHSTMTQQVNEIKKLNVNITQLEKEMIDLKLKYEAVCESRNYTGIQLIDRNDELCILYEKANIQDSIQKRGENEIRNRENEIRMLKLEFAEVKRQIEVVRKQIPMVPQLSSQVLELKAELDEQRKEEKRLAAKLEDPSNRERFRDLPGEDPDEEALEAKIQVLEERLNNKKEQLLEKELVLEEISNLADKLRAQALTGRQSTLELAERVNNFQSRIKNLTRKMMATVSELSMYQATAMKLQQEKERIESILHNAYERIDDDLPPTEECEKEWDRMEKHRAMAEEERRTRKEREEEERMLPGQVTRTTAEPRHNAYIPDDGLGLPKPYGSHAPFKATVLGSTSRHVRKPQPKPIEI